MLVNQKVVYLDGRSNPSIPNAMSNCEVEMEDELSVIAKVFLDLFLLEISTRIEQKYRFKYTIQGKTNEELFVLLYKKKQKRWLLSSNVFPHRSCEHILWLALGGKDGDDKS